MTSLLLSSINILLSYQFLQLWQLDTYMQVTRKSTPLHLTSFLWSRNIYCTADYSDFSKSSLICTLYLLLFQTFCILASDPPSIPRNHPDQESWNHLRFLLVLYSNLQPSPVDLTFQNHFSKLSPSSHPCGCCLFQSHRNSILRLSLPPISHLFYSSTML